MKILVIQTAFIGDVVLATGMVEKLHQYYPTAQIDLLLRKGNEGLLKGHPFIHTILVWDKKQDKYKNLYRLLRQIRHARYDYIFNLQRFMASAVLTAFSGAKHKVGFDKSPLAFLYDEKYPHDIGKKGDTHYTHEAERNHQLIHRITDEHSARPKLYPTQTDFDKVTVFKAVPYITIAPASVWFTKQFPAAQWASFLSALSSRYHVYLLGGKGDTELCQSIADESGNPNLTVLAGRLSFLETAALMLDAVMNYTNDSAPLHFASAMNATVTAVFCSTIPEFGFGPLSDRSFVVELQEPLACRPCGLHGYKACPLGHFNCAKLIRTEQLLAVLP